MNKLSVQKRASVLNLLVEGTSMRTIKRSTGVSISTVTKLLLDAGEACATFHNETVRGVRSRFIECDEIWSFAYARAGGVPGSDDASNGAVDVWTYTALDADSKVILSYLVAGEPDGLTALEFMDDLQRRIDGRTQLSNAGLGAYLRAVGGAFGGGLDYAEVVRGCGTEPGIVSERCDVAAVGVNVEKPCIRGNANVGRAGTAYVERRYLPMIEGVRRIERLTNGSSKKVDKHVAMLALYFVHYNFCRIDRTLRVTPAMAAGVDDAVRNAEWIVELIDANARVPKKGGFEEKGHLRASSEDR